MNRASVWYQLLVHESAATQDQLQALVGAGVHLYPLSGAEPRGSGLIFFDRVSDALCEFARDASQHGRNRVLAIGTEKAALSGGGVWRLLRSGISDVFAWDHSEDPAGEVVARLERWVAVDRLVDSPLVRNNLVGRSPAWIALLRQVVEAASFTDSSVLIVGESGTGKELVARLIQSLDSRPRKRDLVVLDCTTIVPELSGSEFFGHERGSFTGATGTRDGAFALANQGTLFLDEIGELPLPLQAQLLRVVQERTYKRVGGNQWHTTSFRLICATNRPLHRDVVEGRFRADLYYRIATIVCHLPPLRDRPGDIVPLFEHFFTELHPGDPPELDEAVRDYLVRRSYAGNVRDLKQLAARIAYRHVGPGPITVGDLPEDERPSEDMEENGWRDAQFDTSIRRAVAQGVGLKEIGRLAAETAIRIAMDDEQGNVRRAAIRLGVTDRALQLRKAAGRQNGLAAPEKSGVEAEPVAASDRLSARDRFHDSRNI